MTEIEIKVQVENDRQLKQFLAKEAKLVKEERQTDSYFTPKDRSYADAVPIKEWLRLRQAKDGALINYKCWHYQPDGTSHHNDEHETAIGNIDQARSILEVLGFEPLINVQKKRLSYQYQDYEISIDEVEGLGSFVEIEWKGQNGVNPKEITDQMMVFLQRFDPGRIDRGYKGYPKLLLERKLGRSLR